MVYCTANDVLHTTGFTQAKIAELYEPFGGDEAQVVTLIEGYIADAQKQMQDELGIYTIIRKELHTGTGEDDVFTLGQEDEEGYQPHTVEDCLIDVVHCYIGGFCRGNRRLRPYPTNCELGTEVSVVTNYWDDSTTTDSINTTTMYAGSYAVQGIFSATTEYLRYPKISSDYWIDKNIDIYGFVAFYVRASVDNTVVTLRLYDGDGNYNSTSYTIAKKNHWYLVMFDLEEDFSGSVDWEDTKLMYIDFMVNQACTLIVDNFNFNDGWMFTAPAGEVAIMRQLDDQPLERNFPFYVTYRFDPYAVDVPRNVKKACACLAGIDLIDFVRGIRVQDTDVDAQAESGVPDYTRDPLTITRRDLEKKYEEAINSIGRGFEFIPVKG